MTPPEPSAPGPHDSPSVPGSGPGPGSDPDAAPLLRLRGIGRTYDLGGEPVHALADVDEDVRAGEHLAIMGPSGSGKSTLLNVLGCLDRPDRGTYELAGRDVAGLDDAALTDVRRHLIGFIFQSFHLVPRLTALENVELPLVFAGAALDLGRGERRQRARAALAAVGLGERAGHRPNQLSGGERQRVAVARATILGPKVLLADEPTGNLDTTSGRQILELLERLNDEGLTLIVVTHDPAVAARADRVMVMVDGRIARRLPGSEVARTADLFARPGLA
ncbi:MAG TPA: ABC transporter ATP-binding protein [Thermoanaerobaculia bacterium]|nr:ABC transporter ATP-binding protein [Thermoanaerobaculia bacterium]